MISIHLLSFLLLFDLVAELPLRYTTAHHSPFELEPLSSSRLDSLISFSVSLTVSEFDHTHTHTHTHTPTKGV